MTWFGNSKGHRNAAKKRVTRTVARVIDGDTFVTKRRIGNTNKVRLANVDAPERGRSGGTRATNMLRGMIGGKKVSVTPVGRSYDRVVARVTQNRRNINKRMVGKLK
ncbi:thermonuclease family protein [Nanoarchaeota archaeon]